MSNEEILEFSQYIELEVYNSIKKDILKRIKEISSLAVELFKKKFWYENNEARNWNRYEDEELDSLFLKIKAEFSDIFETFKIFRVVKHPLKCKFIFIF